MIVAWNSLMISGLAKAYAVFRVPKYLELAIASANFICNNQFLSIPPFSKQGMPAVVQKRIL